MHSWRSSVQTVVASVRQHLITVRLQNAEGVPHENSQKYSLEQEITLTLILKSHGKSATDPAASAARIRSEDANVLTHVASQMRQRPREKGNIVIPSGRFPSPRSRPDGSSMDGIPDTERPRRTTSLKVEWRGMRPALKRHDKG